MVNINGKFYNSYILPKVPQVSDDFLREIAMKYKAFRMKAISEPGSFAFGRTKFEVEESWPLQSYYDELNDTQKFYAIAVETTSDLPAHQAIKEGTWIGIGTVYGPIPVQDWTLPTVNFGKFPEELEYRFHGGNAYMIEAYRGFKRPSGKTLFTHMSDTMDEFLVDYIRLHSPRLPAYYHVRATVSVPKLLEYWCARAHTLAGWIPQVTYSLVMRTRIKDWPAIEQDPGFYEDCKFAIIEKMVKIGKSSQEIIEPQGVKSSL